MSYKNRVYTKIKSSFQTGAGGGQASQATLNSINEMAMETAEAVANDIQDNLIVALDDMISSLNNFMTAIQTSAVVPYDGGATYKANLISPAASVKSSITILVSKIAMFRG